MTTLGERKDDSTTRLGEGCTEESAIGVAFDGQSPRVDDVVIRRWDLSSTRDLFLFPSFVTAGDKEAVSHLPES